MSSLTDTSQLNTIGELTGRHFSVKTIGELTDRHFSVKTIGELTGRYFTTEDLVSSLADTSQ